MGCGDHRDEQQLLAETALESLSQATAEGREASRTGDVLDRRVQAISTFAELAQAQAHGTPPDETQRKRVAQAVADLIDIAPDERVGAFLVELTKISLRNSMLSPLGLVAREDVTLERAADAMWKDAAKTAAAGAGALEDAARAVEMGEALDSAGQIMLASGIQDLTRAADLQTVATRVASLSEIVAESGAADVAQGAEMLVAADDVETVSAVVGVMSLADLDRGMELARVSGELQAASRIVDKLKMPLLSAFLDDRSGKMGQMAVDNILLASATRALAAAMAATGKKLEDLSATEVAEGIVRLAASDALAERSDELAAESGDSAAAGLRQAQRGGGARSGGRPGPERSYRRECARRRGARRGDRRGCDGGQHGVFDGRPDAPGTLVYAHTEDRHQPWWSAVGLAFVALVRWTLVRPDPVPVAQPE